MPTLRLGRLATAALLLALPAAPAAAQYSVTYGQGNFGSLDGWTGTEEIRNSTVTYSNSLIATGGNPGSYWQHDFRNINGAANSGVRMLWINEDYRWSLNDHLLASLSVSIDARSLSSGFTENVAGFLVPLIRQNDAVFRLADATGSLSQRVTNTVGWTTLSWSMTDFTSASWQRLSGASATLDMNASGSDLFFGFAYSLACVQACSDVSARAGLDNLSFTARAIPTEVPEPSSWLLLVAAAPLFLLARATGRRHA